MRTQKAVARKSPAFHTVFGRKKHRGFVHILIALVIIILIILILTVLYEIFVPAPLTQAQIVGANCNTSISCVFQVANTGASVLTTDGSASLTSMSATGNCESVVVGTGSTANILCTFGVQGAPGTPVSGTVSFHDQHIPADHYAVHFNTTLEASQ